MDTVGTFSSLAPVLANEREAQLLFVRLRWPDGVRCPHCGHERFYETKGPNADRLQWKCAAPACRKKFACTTGTVLEGSHIPVRKWLHAIYVVCSSKKGVSASQLARDLGLSYKAAWFMAHRLRFAMTKEPLAGLLGGAGDIVEADETYVGGRRKGKRGRGAEGKIIVMVLLDRGSGAARAVTVPDVRGQTVKDVIRHNVKDTTYIVTDQLKSYKGLDKEFAGHGSVDHSKEYVRGVISTNFAESYFSLLKRGILGTFHHLSAQHMDRYLNEFSFRWTTRKMADGRRAVLLVRAADGVRLTYRGPRRGEGGNSAEDSLGERRDADPS